MSDSLEQDDVVVDEESGDIIELRCKKSSTDNVVDGSYKIILDEPIRELSNNFVKYYKAEGINNSKNGYFAIVFEKFFLFSLSKLQMMCNLNNEYLILPIAVNIVFITTIQEWRIAVIIPEYDYQSTLDKLINDTGAISTKVIFENLVPAFESIFRFCESNNLYLGNLKAENILYLNQKFILREFFIHYPNFFHSSYILPMELFDCIPSGRVPKNSTADIYSFGAVLIYSILGYKNWEKYSEEEFKKLRYQTSSYFAFIGKTNFPEELRNLFKGLLYDLYTERWKSRALKDWIQGKATKMAISSNTDATAPILFQQESYFGCRHLAHDMLINWNLANEFIKDDKLLKWAQKNVSKVSIIKSLEDMIASHSIAAPKSDRLFKILHALDPHGPLRYKGLAITFTSLPQVVMYSHINNDNDTIAIINELLSKSSWRTVVSSAIVESQQYELFNQILEEALKFFNPQNNINNERFIYAINLNIPCQSSNLFGKYVTNLEDLMIALNEIAANNYDMIMMDKHIKAFICHRIALKRDIKVGALSAYPDLMNNSMVSALGILVLAQQRSRISDLKNLSKIIAARLQKILDDFLHNKHVKELFRMNLNKSAEKGSLDVLLNAFCNISLLHHDHEGYLKASNEIKILDSKIELLNSKDKIYDIGRFFGLRFTVLFSYCVLFFVVFIMLIT